MFANLSAPDLNPSGGPTTKKRGTHNPFSIPNTGIPWTPLLRTSLYLESELKIKIHSLYSFPPVPSTGEALVWWPRPHGTSLNNTVARVSSSAFFLTSAATQQKIPHPDQPTHSHLCFYTKVSGTWEKPQRTLRTGTSINVEWYSSAESPVLYGKLSMCLFM